MELLIDSISNTKGILNKLLMSNHNLLSKPKYNAQEEMSDANSVLKYKHISQERNFQKDKLNVIKSTITRLFMVGGIWTIFFMVYKLKETEPLSFQPIIIALLAIYALGEILFMFYDINRIDKN